MWVLLDFYTVTFLNAKYRNCHSVNFLHLVLTNGVNILTRFNIFLLSLFYRELKTG